MHKNILTANSPTLELYSPIYHLIKDLEKASTEQEKLDIIGKFYNQNELVRKAFKRFDIHLNSIKNAVPKALKVSDEDTDYPYYRPCCGGGESWLSPINYCPSCDKIYSDYIREITPDELKKIRYGNLTEKL